MSASDGGRLRRVKRSRARPVRGPMLRSTAPSVTKPTNMDAPSCVCWLSATGQHFSGRAGGVSPLILYVPGTTIIVQTRGLTPPARPGIRLHLDVDDLLDDERTQQLQHE